MVIKVISPMSEQTVHYFFFLCPLAGDCHSYLPLLGDVRVPSAEKGDRQVNMVK
jgi:hypothetical protein